MTREEGPEKARPAASAPLRRLLILGLLTAGWLFGLALAAAAEERPDRVTDLVDGSLHGLVRTAEDVPGTLTRTAHRPLRSTVRTVSATLGDTPRVLGRSGPALVLRPPSLAAGGAEPVGLPPRVRGVVAGHPDRSTPDGPAAGLSVPAPVAPVAASRGALAPDGYAAGAQAQDGRAARAHTARAELRTAGDTAVQSDHHRTPVPYAPAAPGSFTAGSAASSSNAAGPAIHLPRAARIRLPQAIVPPPATGATRPALNAPAREPRHTPD